MSVENLNLDPANRQPLGPETFVQAAGVIHNASHTALNQLPDGSNPYVQNQAIEHVLSKILSADMGNEAQQVLWEASSSMARATIANDVSRGILQSIDYSLDIVRNHRVAGFNGRTISSSRLDFLQKAVYGDYGVAGARQEVNYLANQLEQSSADEETKQHLWQRDVTEYGFRTSERAQLYYKESFEQVEESGHALRHGVNQASSGVSEVDKLASYQTHVGQDLIAGRQPDSNALKTATRLFSFAETVKDSILETDAQGLAERFQAIIEKAPSTELIHDIAQSVVDCGAGTVSHQTQLTERFADEMTYAVHIAREDIENSFSSAARSLNGESVYIGSALELLVRVPSGALQQLNILAQGWADQVSTQLQTIITR